MSTRRSDMRTWAEIDLDAVQRNVRRIAERRPEHRIMAVVKADAYGHGAVPVASAALAAGAFMVGVGDSREAIELVEAGIAAPILVLGAIVDGEMAAMVRHDIRTTIHSNDRITLLEREAAAQGRVHRVHLKVDTGMGRLGVMPEKARELAARVAASPHLELEGLGTHFANSHLDHCETSLRQVEVFRRVVEEVREAVGEIPIIHAMNTAAAWNLDVAADFTDTLRVGAALYGIPGPTDRPYPFEPAMTLKSQIIFMKDVPAGTAVGYNGTYVTPERTRLATLPLGYNDGLPPSSRDGGFVIVRGAPAPIRGAVSMDYTTVDVTHIPGCRVGDEVLLFGRTPESCLSLADFAARVGSSPYAITCGIGKRVHRLYFRQQPGSESDAGVFLESSESA
ncbi:MAG: alanine racemase [Planctomycetota bacterium]